VPSQDLTVVVLTQRAAHETGMPAVCDEVLAAARAAVQVADGGPGPSAGRGQAGRGQAGAGRPARAGRRGQAG
jgi:hypothetical protein